MYTVEVMLIFFKNLKNIGIVFFLSMWQPFTKQVLTSLACFAQSVNSVLNSSSLSLSILDRSKSRDHTHSHLSLYLYYNNNIYLTTLMPKYKKSIDPHAHTHTKQLFLKELCFCFGFLKSSLLLKFVYQA